MKQTFQSIKVDVVDQEVAAINTQTSDQATESDFCNTAAVHGTFPVDPMFHKTSQHEVDPKLLET